MAIKTAAGYGGKIVFDATSIPAGYGNGFGIGTTMVVYEWTARLDIDLIEIPAAFGEIWTEHDLGDGKLSGTLNYKIKISSTTKPFTLPASSLGWRSQFSGMLTLFAGEADYDGALTADCSIGPFQVVVSGIDFGRSNKTAMTGTANWTNCTNDLAAADIVWQA